jgi:hypothetical protein
MVVQQVGPGGAGEPACVLVVEYDVGVCGADYDVAGGVVDEVEHCRLRVRSRGGCLMGLGCVGLLFDDGCIWWVRKWLCAGNC